MVRITLLLLLALPLAACDGPTPLVALGAADVSSIMVFHRDIPDLLFSAVTGRDCSVVRLDKGQSYCRPLEPPPPPPAYCTRTLGLPECWASPVLPTNPAQGVADGPRTLTEEQEENRTRPWPGIFSGVFY